MSTLGKTERLYEKNLLSTLFSQTKPFRIANGRYLLRVYLRCVSVSESEPIRSRILVSAPKSSFKLAVHRNRVKRLLRESFRDYKPIFNENIPSDIQLHIAFIFTQQGKVVNKSDLNLEHIKQLMIKCSPFILKTISKYGSKELQ